MKIRVRTRCRGTYRTIIGVIGDEAKLQTAPLLAIDGVAEALGRYVRDTQVATSQATEQFTQFDVAY